jgi:hypothetical protein
MLKESETNLESPAYRVVPATSSARRLAVLQSLLIVSSCAAERHRLGCAAISGTGESSVTPNGGVRTLLGQ